MSSSTAIQKISDEALYRCQYVKHNQNNLFREIKRQGLPRLSASQKRQIDDLWGSVRRFKNYDWHAYYLKLTERFDPQFVPNDIYFLELISRLQNTDLCQAWADKAYYNERFAGCARFPETLVRCIDGRLYDPEGVQLASGEAVEILLDEAKVISKPSLGSCTGIGVEVWEPSRLNRAGLTNKLNAVGPNFVIQRLIAQHEIMAKLNASSVNIMRVNTLRLGSRIYVLQGTIRFGVPGSVTDVSHLDGRETLRLLGVDSDGRMFGAAMTEVGESIPLENYGVSPETIVPGYQKACETCMNLHTRLHHFDLVGFDVAIEKDGSPTVIEFNLRGPGVMFYQLVHGPFFGEHTDQLLGVLSHIKPKRPSFLI